MARKKRYSIDIRNGYHTIVMADMEIWDGADLALLRETLAKLAEEQGQKKIGVDMTFVKYVPSGFFGMLYDYTERGHSVRIYNPLNRVQSMLWFREFFDDLGDGVYSLALRQQTSLSNQEAVSKAPWVTHEPVPQPEPVLHAQEHPVAIP